MPLTSTFRDAEIEDLEVLDASTDDVLDACDDLEADIDFDSAITFVSVFFDPATRTTRTLTTTEDLGVEDILELGLEGEYLLGTHEIDASDINEDDDETTVIDG